MDVTVADSRGDGSVPASFLYALRVMLHIIRRRGDYDLVHINTSIRASTLRKGLIASAARLAKMPYVIHLHGSGYDEFYEHVPRVLQWWIRRYFTRASRVIVLGEHWRRFVLGTLNVASDRVTILPNTAPGPETWAPRDRVGPLRAVFLGRLDERKGCHLALEALAQLRVEGIDVLLVVAGDGEDEPLRRFASAHALEVDFLGWIGQERVHATLEGSDVLLLPSASENQPIAVIEAMAHGVVPVATPVGAVPDLFDHGESGLLLATRTARAVADAVRQLDDQALLAGLAMGARKRWEARLTPHLHAAQLVSAWSSMGSIRESRFVDGDRPV